ncbi:MAG: UDP-N-acetylglucosamine 2-epimerase (non-hydrolyzing) [Oligoflexia bacterium]|nr:UDP-N-acetylglucosamine 2-epimerase (non-hydrolyzing) [Oligoflexia bacterium]
MKYATLSSKKIWVLIGTRPEAIKQIPVYKALVEKFGKEAVALVGTGQHHQLIDQVLVPFETTMDFNFQLMLPQQTPTSLSAAILAKLNDVFLEIKPDWIVVQGDTTSAAMAGYAAFLNHIKVVHNEAGLRSYDMHHPFPEEANRRLLTTVSDVHMAPTTLAQDALIQEGVNPKTIFLTGNSGIDSFLKMLERQPSPRVEELLTLAGDKKIVFMTAHRRENQGEGMDQWFHALRIFFQKNPHLYLLYPMHPNQLALAATKRYLSDLHNVCAIDPLGYEDCCHLIAHSLFVVTDSGGIQEEAASLGKQVVVCRKKTERMEAVHAGFATLVGTDIEKIISGMNWALENSRPRLQQKGVPINHFQSLYGHGHSGKKIAEIIYEKSMLIAPTKVRQTTEECGNMEPERSVVVPLKHSYGHLL